MFISYKDSLNSTTLSSVLKCSSGNQDNEISIEFLLERICSDNLISSSDEVQIIMQYCNNSNIDDFGINLFLFKLAFCEKEYEDNDFRIIHLLMKTLQLPSFNPSFFLNPDCINCLVDHILCNDQLSKYALIFLINLLYKTERRFFLTETYFFNMFQEERIIQNESIRLYFQDLLFAFFSQNEEIDQEMFDALHEYISQCFFSNMDIHQQYRYFMMILSLSEKNIKIEDIDVLITSVIDSKEDFMIEIILYLIQYSENPQNFFDYTISSFKNNIENDPIAKASIRIFNFCWDKFNIEQKNIISHEISLSIPCMSYELRFACVSFICNAESWDIFNDLIFFDEILNLISQKDICMKCLYALYHFLSIDIEDAEFNEQKIDLLLSHYDDLNEIAYSSDEAESQIAQVLINAINEALDDENDINGS